MNFTGIPFLLVFLPLFLVGYDFVRPSRRPGLILAAGVCFLAAGQPAALVWLTGLTTAAFGLGLWIRARRDRGQTGAPALWIGILLSAGTLLALKWRAAHGTGFPSAGFREGGFVLPLGISYCTFQIIAYLADVSAGIAPAERNFSRLLGPILFFPKVASGPIVKTRTVADRILRPEPSGAQAVRGCVRIVAGEIKCVCIAGPLGRLADPAFSGLRPELGPAAAWLALIAGVLQVYYNFSGYTDIAVGIGGTMGVRLPENFDYPLVSRSVGELWRRWHMTLLGWFREYVFFPLERRRLRFAGQQVNLIAVFLLTGLWHGPTPNFLAWGALQGLAMTFESLPAGKRFLAAAWRPVRHLYVLFVFLLSWVFFRSPGMGFAFAYLGRLAGAGAGQVRSPDAPGAPAAGSWIAALMIGAVFSLPVWTAAETRLKRAAASPRFRTRLPAGAAGGRIAGFLWTQRRWWLVPMAAVFALFGIVYSLTMTAAASPFIYTQF
jgi:alginate O-acetyltransferase complex protein AlgI